MSTTETKIPVNNQIADIMKDRMFTTEIEKEVIGDTVIRYWGLTDGTTIRITEVNRVKVAWEEIPEPLGVVARHLKVARGIS